MEFEIRKKFILTSGILYIIFAVISLILSIVVLTDNEIFTTLSKYLEQYIEYYYQISISAVDVSKIVNIALIVSLVFGVLGILFGVYFIVISRKWTEEMLQAKKVQYIVMTIVSFLLCGNVLTLIFLILALLAKKENTVSSQELADVKQDEIKKDDDNLKMLEEIERLKKLKNSGALSDEEYTELLSKIIK